MAIKAIVMDIDGTLLTEKKISPKTRQALVDAQKQRPITDFGFWPASGSNGMQPLAVRILEMAHYNGHLLFL